MAECISKENLTTLYDLLKSGASSQDISNVCRYLKVDTTIERVFRTGSELNLPPELKAERVGELIDLNPVCQIALKPKLPKAKVSLDEQQANQAGIRATAMPWKELIFVDENGTAKNMSGSEILKKFGLKTTGRGVASCTLASEGEEGARLVDGRWVKDCMAQPDTILEQMCMLKPAPQIHADTNGLQPALKFKSRFVVIHPNIRGSDKVPEAERNTRDLCPDMLVNRDRPSSQKIFYWQCAEDANCGDNMKCVQEGYQHKCFPLTIRPRKTVVTRRPMESMGDMPTSESGEPIYPGMETW